MSEKTEEPIQTPSESAQPSATNQPAAPAVISLFLFVAGAWFFMGGGLESKVAKDAETQYGIASRSGTLIDRCVHAGFVAATYLQSKNEGKYQQWKSQEATDCLIAGVPR